MTMWTDSGGGHVDEWWSDDFEVLHWVVERFERNGHRVEVGEALGAFAQEHDDSARESLRRFSSHAYRGAVNGSEPGRDGGSGAPVVTEVTRRALRGVGGWPDNAELLADWMLAVLAEGAVHKPDPEKRCKLKAGLEGVAAMTRDVLLGVVATAIARATGTAWAWRVPTTRSPRTTPSREIERVPRRGCLDQAVARVRPGRLASC
jgi:hypothetical protein